MGKGRGARRENSSGAGAQGRRRGALLGAPGRKRCLAPTLTPPHPRPPRPRRLLTVGAPPEGRPFYRAAFERLATRLAVPFEVLFAAGPSKGCDPGAAADAPGCIWNVCTVAAASWGGGGGGASQGAQPLDGAADEVAACYCESVFSFTQLLLSVVLPLLLLGLAEARQRRQFAAAELARSGGGAGGGEQEQEGSPRSSRLRRRSEAEWMVSYDSMRLLALLALIQVGGAAGHAGQAAAGRQAAARTTCWLLLLADVTNISRPRLPQCSSESSSACALASGSSTRGRGWTAPQARRHLPCSTASCEPAHRAGAAAPMLQPQTMRQCNEAFQRLPSNLL